MEKVYRSFLCKSFLKIGELRWYGIRFPTQAPTRRPFGARGGVLAAPLGHLWGGKDALGPHFVGLWRPFGGHGGAQGRPREPQGDQKCGK